MSRVLCFELIADSRFCEHPGRAALGYACDIRDEFNKNGIDYNSHVREHPMYTATFGDSYQCRIPISVTKSRKYSWKKIMQIVNKVYAPVYKFI